MSQRRQFLPAIVAVSLFFIWMQVAPVLFPQFFPQNKPLKNLIAQKANNAELNPDPTAEGKEPANDQGERPAEFPEKSIVLGEPGFDAGYLLKVDVSTRGASLDAVWLTDPRYTTLDRKEQLRVVGNDVKRNIGNGDLQTFDTKITAIDTLLKQHNLSLDTVNWEIVSQDVDSVVLQYPSPAGNLVVQKSFRITKVDLATRDTSSLGYLVDVELKLTNSSDHPIQTNYSLIGPVGVPLENVENSRLFREVKVGTIEDTRRPNRITAVTLLANELVKQYENSLREGGKPVVEWRLPIAYAGVDDQFFTALIRPKEDQVTNSTIAAIRPMLLHLNSAKPERSDMTIVIESPQILIPAKDEVTSTYSSFFGPKRPRLIRDLNAESTIQLGWFAFVSKFMLWILGAFKSLGMPFALAIIALTVVVRLAMFPISKKQAIEAEKMKILAPKMKEMQEKYKNQPEEFAKAYREFQRKYNYHPLVGCLPALLQLPIFLGLYNALFYAVDLRLATFLWVDNLAAPDNLFPLGFTVPWFGWTQFNLLPFITVALFVVQQKMFTPPPTSDEQRMQYRIMNVMMIAIGFAFYTVPAGLCLYFISSSLWGVIERLLLKKSLATHQKAVAEAGADNAPDGTVIDVPKGLPKPKQEETGEPAKPKEPTFWQRALAAADEARSAKESQATEKKFSNKKKKNPRRP
ncbi:MAG TPA: YidC/Oxa1 family insertase periplasmic-domain containing protein [Planctomicrobium sp.]|nr:YidC/Oxa1 family insertase periplasmic-domain containing protein [Planctomicrobium sp.]